MGTLIVDMLKILKIAYLRNIFILSFLVALSIPLVDTLFIYPAFKQKLIENTEEEAVRVASALSSNLSITPNQLLPDQFPKDHWPELENMIRDYGLMKLKIYSPAGIVVYSSQIKDIGGLNAYKYFTDIVKKGRVFTQVVKKNHISLENEKFVRDVVETYVPLINQNEFVGAFEIYYDITRQKKDLESLLAKSYKTSGTMLALLCCGLFLTIRKAGKIYERQVAAETALRLHQQELDQRIEARTMELQTANLRLKDEISMRCNKELALKNTAQRLKETLEKLKTTQAHMLQSEKMASIGQLSAGVAHEINNPVGFVKSNLATMEEYRQDVWTHLERLEKFKAAAMDHDTVLTPQALRQAREIDLAAKDLDLAFIAGDFKSVVVECKEGMERIACIVADLKNFSHADTGKIDYFNLNAGVESTLNIVWNELKYKATVTKELGNIPMVKGNRQQIDQVVMNMLVNAAQSIDKKGSIRIATRETDHHVEIAFSDTGCGIPPDILSKIYDPFFTTKDVGDGTGLGLNVVYNIIKTHGGTIGVQSTVNQGTTFTITLPVDGVQDENLTDSDFPSFGHQSDKPSNNRKRYRAAIPR